LQPFPFNFKLMKNTEQKWFEEHQEEICDYCETFIIEGSSNSQHFQCEGRYCEKAGTDYKESFEEDELGIWTDSTGWSEDTSWNIKDGTAKPTIWQDMPEVNLEKVTIKPVPEIDFEELKAIINDILNDENLCYIKK